MARSSELLPPLVQRGMFQAAWILYLPADLARSITPPDVPVVETLQDGGLLLAATTDTFRTDNPDQLGASVRRCFI